MIPWRFRYSQEFDPLKHLREKDPGDNAKTSPPKEEFIDFCCMWGVEFYTPAHTEDLVEGFKRLGWGEDGNLNLFANPIAWINGSRRYQQGGSWLNLGELIPSNVYSRVHSRSTMNARRVALPASVESASAWMYSVTPSLIGIVVCFVFDEVTSASLDQALRKDRQTFATPRGQGWQYHEPWKQKSDHISSIRTKASKNVATWFSENLPGLFSSGLLEGEIPTCEFITLRAIKPNPSIEDKGNRPDYLRLLGVSHDLETWKCNRIPCLTLGITRDWESRPQHHTILATNESQFVHAIPDGYGREHRSSRIRYADLIMPKLISIWATLPMLEGYTQHISQVRSSTELRNEALRSPLKALKTLGSQVSYSVDIAAVTSELAAHSKDGFSSFYDLEAFEPCNPSLYREELSLRDYLSFAILRQASWLQETDVSIRSHLTQFGALLGAIESVRVQKKITILTWALLGIGFITLIAPVLPAIYSLVSSVILSYVGD